MADQLSATNIVAPANGQTDGPHLHIDNSPMCRSNPWDGESRSVELKQLNDNCLLLEPRNGAFLQRLLILAVCAGPLAYIVCMLVNEVQGNAGWILIVFLVIGLLLMSALLLCGLFAPGRFNRWVRFDRRAGLLTISRRPFGFRRSLQAIRARPLTEIVCVQLLYAGFKCDSVEIGEPGTPGSVVHQNYHSYQLNLAFDDRAEPRYNLTTHSDWKWMREAGQRLADFLRVPVVDHLAHGTQERR
jgi:hypothetical protein